MKRDTLIRLRLRVHAHMMAENQEQFGMDRTDASSEAYKDVTNYSANDLEVMLQRFEDKADALAFGRPSGS